MPNSSPLPPGHICTLWPSDRSAQERRWVALLAKADSVRHEPTGVVVDFPIQIAGEVRSLVDAELACCGSWLQLRSSSEGKSVRLHAAASSPEGAARLHKLAGAEQ